MSDYIKLNIFTGKALEIAKKIDNENVKDQQLTGKEISLFLADCEKNNIDVQRESWFNKCANVLAKYLKKVKPHVEPNDATYVAPKPRLEINKPLNTTPVKKTTNTSTDYKNHPSYQKVYEMAKKALVAKYNVENYTDVPKHARQLAETNISKVIPLLFEICKKYEVEELSPLFIQIIGRESEFGLEDDLVNAGKSFKGSMQVGYEEICSIYGNIGSGNFALGKNKTVTVNNEDNRFGNEHRMHLSKSDIEKIKKLKEIYPTPQSMYKAIQSDVGLGIEMGILTFKIKLSYAKGNVHEAQKMYCGRQYTCDLSDVPAKFDIKKRNTT